MSDEKSGIKTTLLAETKTMRFLFVSLSLLLGAFTMYRRLVLAEYHIGSFQYGAHHGAPEPHKRPRIG